ncbi:hypothetical protein DPMN_174826 [Dreissena polymorpha]|uniref:Uncharacterized protein n=1 Tax=Dreissena polymorpha TaxID=45954 RepID=A0A9D4IHH8_DREPO|nr:hypothetical protein DPMN_174826 [Dreissena polymorpha]
MLDHRRSVCLKHDSIILSRMFRLCSWTVYGNKHVPSSIIPVSNKGNSGTNNNFNMMMIVIFFAMITYTVHSILPVINP